MTRKYFVFRENDMALEVEVSKDGTRRIFRDNFSMRSWEEFRCAGCGIWMNTDDIVWCRKDGTLSTTDPESLPWCTNCYPEQDDYDEKNTTTCTECGIDFPDGEMLPLRDGGEVCIKCSYHFPEEQL